MKNIKIFILLVGLLCCQLVAFTQEPAVKTSNLKIYSDTVIAVRKLFDEGCKLYGDIILLDEDKTKTRFNNEKKKIDERNYIRYGGDGKHFDTYMKEANGNKDDYKKYIKRNNDSLVINLLYDELPAEGLKLYFYGVLYDSVLINKNGKLSSYEWYRDKNTKYCVSITKSDTTQHMNNLSNGKDIGIKPFAGGEVSKDTTNVHGSDESDFETTDKTQKSMMSILLFLIICIFIVVFVRINKLNRRINSIVNSHNQSTFKSEDININKIKIDVIQRIQPKDIAQRLSKEDVSNIITSKIQLKDLVERITNEDIHDVINRSGIQLYIKTLIAEIIDEYLHNKIDISAPQNVVRANLQPSVVQPELRTTKVEYRADNNCFVILENSQNKIFEIYSINGEYYYTIVNDPSIRKEMLGFITAFSGYVETRQTSPIPSTVEVIRDGRLIKNGDMYIVDTNCILQVSLM